MSDYMQMTLEQLQKEHAELLLFNDDLDRSCKAFKAESEKYQTKCWHIQTLLINPADKEMTLKAIETVIERVGEVWNITLNLNSHPKPNLRERKGQNLHYVILQISLTTTPEVNTLSKM